MTSDEFVNIYINTDFLTRAVSEAKKYATLSLPWTINRMSYKMTPDGLEKRLMNIILGKLPEIFLREAFHRLDISADFARGTTPYWQTDRFDLMIRLNGESEEWDIKSLNMDLDLVKADMLLNLPALVPDNYRMDQWSRRGKCADRLSRRKRFIFTFLNSFGLKVSLSQGQYQNFKKIVDNKAYYENQKDYILRMLSPVDVTMSKNNTLLMITGCAGPDEWQSFNDIPPGSSFLNGLFGTRIQNKGCTIRDLPAVKNLLRIDENNLFL